MQKYLGSLAITSLLAVITLTFSNVHAATVSNRKSTRILENTAEVEPRHELGFNYGKAYISDLKTYWDNGSLFYYNINDYGHFGGRVNYLRKFSKSSEQYQLDMYPKINEKIYANLAIAFASKSQNNFPSIQYAIAAYLNHETLEFSLGQYGRIYSMFSNQKIYTYTGTIGIYFDNYFAWLRPNYYTPLSLFTFEAGIIRYFMDKYNYVRLSIATGRLPDIGDLPPLDQMIIAKLKGINLSGQFNMVQKLYLYWGMGYAKYRYPNTLRYVTEGTLGLTLRF